jgi:hypothetical protein
MLNVIASSSISLQLAPAFIHWPAFSLSSWKERGSSRSEAAELAGDRFARFARFARLSPLFPQTGFLSRRLLSALMAQAQN